MPEHDVLIVGAGPVGLLLACLLLQEGVDVVVCEQRDGADDRTRAIGIHAPGLAALERAGVGETVRAEALRLAGGEVVSRGRVLADLDFAEDRPVLVLPQPRTAAMLRDRLEMLSAGSLRPGRRIIRLVQDHVGVRADAAAGHPPITASYAVIADGVHSALRRALGFGWRRRPGAARYAMSDVADTGTGDRAQLFCEPDGLVESFPLPDGRRRWVVRLGEGEERCSAASFRDVIAQRTGIRPAIPDDVVPAVFRARQHLAARLVRGRVALLGDAAHEISPIGGQGMNLGWLGAARLSRALVCALPLGSSELPSYERRTLRAAAAAQRRAAFYMAMGSPAHGLPLQAREALIRVLGSPPLREPTAGLITMRGL